MAKRKLRIGFTVQNMNYSLSGSTHAAALQLTHIIRGLQSRRHEVTILAPRPQRKVLCTDNLDIVHYGQLGISGMRAFKLVESGIRRWQVAWRLPYLGLFDSYRFYDACCKNLAGCEILHERNNLFSIGTALASRRLGVPYVLSLDADELFELDYQGESLKGIRRIIAEQMARFTYRVADAFTCVSPAAKTHFANRWGIPEEKIWVLPNGVDIQFFQPDANATCIRSKLGLNGKPIVMFVGGFYPWHGLSILVESFRQVMAEIPNAQLVLVGDGKTKPVIVQQVDEYGLNQAVTFTGAVDHSDIPAYLQAADVCVAPYPKFPSEFWGAPMKLYEYMAAGKTIVASGAGIIAEVIQNDDNGLLVEPGDVNGFARAIIRVIKDPISREQFAYNARQQAVKQHSWEQYIKRLEEVYLSVLKNSSVG